MTYHLERHLNIRKQFPYIPKTIKSDWLKRQILWTISIIFIVIISAYLCKFISVENNFNNLFQFYNDNNKNKYETITLNKNQTINSLDESYRTTYVNSESKILESPLKCRFNQKQRIVTRVWSKRKRKRYMLQLMQKKHFRNISTLTALQINDTIASSLCKWNPKVFDESISNKIKIQKLKHLKNVSKSRMLQLNETTNSSFRECSSKTFLESIPNKIKLLKMEQNGQKHIGIEEIPKQNHFNARTSRILPLNQTRISSFRECSSKKLKETIIQKIKIPKMQQKVQKHIGMEEIYHDYCVIGAGPAGLQMGYFLNRASRDYIIYERNNISGNGVIFLFANLVQCLHNLITWVF